MLTALLLVWIVGIPCAVLVVTAAVGTFRGRHPGSADVKTFRNLLLAPLSYQLSHHGQLAAPVRNVLRAQCPSQLSSERRAPRA